MERLTWIDDLRVAAHFEGAVEDDDKRVSMAAARYLAAAERLGLAEWLALAADKPTHARYLAARSVIGDLERTWHATKGDLPTVPWKEAQGAADQLKKLSTVLAAWEAWARENPKFSHSFFDADRRHWAK